MCTFYNNPGSSSLAVFTPCPALPFQYWLSAAGVDFRHGGQRIYSCRVCFGKVFRFHRTLVPSFTGAISLSHSSSHPARTFSIPRCTFLMNLLDVLSLFLLPPRSFDFHCAVVFFQLPSFYPHFLPVSWVCLRNFFCPPYFFYYFAPGCVCFQTNSSRSTDEAKVAPNRAPKNPAGSWQNFSLCFSVQLFPLAGGVTEKVEGTWECWWFFVRFFVLFSFDVLASNFDMSVGWGAVAKKKNPASLPSLPYWLE